MSSKDIETLAKDVSTILSALFLACVVAFWVGGVVGYAVGYHYGRASSQDGER